MVLDAVLVHPDWSWLSTEEEKLAHFTFVHHLTRVVVGRRSTTVREYPHKLPIGRPRDESRVVLLSLVTSPARPTFASSWRRTPSCSATLPDWSVRLLVPTHLTTAAADHLAPPLRPSVVDELRWYVEARRVGLTTTDPRFQILARLWTPHGDRVLTATLSPRPARRDGPWSWGL